MSDILRLDRICAACPLDMRLYRPLEDPEGLLRFKIFGPEQPIPLSDVLPMLERMGLRVLTARPYEIATCDGARLWVLDFNMREDTGIQVDAPQVKDIFQDAFAKLWTGEAENDGFNRLVLAARLPWRDVAILRAYCRYLLQTRIPFSQAYMERTLSDHSAIARMLVDLFHARFAPDARDGAERHATALLVTIEEALEKVSSLDEDRILRRFLNIIQATLRTNFFQTDPQGQPKDYLSFKFDPTRIDELPLPRPMFEVFVYSPRVEAVHLRGGPVARGGLRWSDRREDFRTEVLGLMKAQMVKNAVIVPVGAKGGFVLKQAPARREELQREAIACYQTFIRGLLDITDNRVAGHILRRREWCATTVTTPIWWCGGQGHGDLFRYRQCSGPRNTVSGWAMPSPPAVRLATTIRKWASPHAVPGSRSSAIFAKWASDIQPDDLPWSASATCPATCSATACCCPPHPADRGLQPPPYLHRPESRSGDEFHRARAPVRAAALRLGDYDESYFPRAGRWSRVPPSPSSSVRKRGGLGIRAHADPRRSDPPF